MDRPGLDAVADDLLRRVTARGGELRLAGSIVQFRPVWTLTTEERRWLVRHQVVVVAALTPPSPDDVAAFVRWLERWLAPQVIQAGEAGPGTPAWLTLGRYRASPSTPRLNRGADALAKLADRGR